jgi:predicted Zn finger-like uncharacterized protein
MVEITCPQCNYSKSVPLEKIPPRIKWVRCPRCGSRFEYISRGEGIRTDKRHATPWEIRLELGLWKGIEHTVKAVLFSPRNMFSTMTVRGGWREPLAFGLLVGSIGSMVAFFWDFMAASSGLLKPFWAVSASAGSPFVFLLFIFLSPLLVTFDILISSIIIHALLLLVRGGKNGYEATFRVVAYSQATRAWSLIPFVGGPIGYAWRTIVYIIGLKESQETSYTRVILAFSIPFILLILLISALFVFIMCSINI